jgi:hypothetical protein
MVGFFQQSPIHSQQVLEEQKEKGKKTVELVAQGLIGPFWLLMQNGQIEPHRSLISSFALFFLFLVTECELGIGFPKELCVVRGCSTAP